MFLSPRISLVVLAFTVFACTDDQEVPDVKGYPLEVGKIITTRCAVTGCHNSTSKAAAGGLSLASWSEMLEGGNNKNPAVVPFWKDQSTVFLFSNQYEELGLSVPPLMPFGREPLAKDEVTTLMNWIENGARNVHEELPFHDHGQKDKFYVINDGCDLVSVFDLASGLLIRYIDVGSGFDKPAESIRVSPDGAHWYIMGDNGLLKKMDCTTDKQVGSLQLVDGFWRAFEVAENNSLGIASNWTGNSGYSGGSIALIDLVNMTVIAEVNAVSDSIFFPQGMALHPTDSTLLCAANTSNFYYKVDFRNPTSPVVNRLPIKMGETEAFTGSLYRPVEMSYTPDGQRYIMLCARSNEVRVYDAVTDTFQLSIPVGDLPSDFVFAPASNELIVSCTEDVSQGGKGLLYIINTSNWQVTTTVNPGYQPKGLIYDAVRGDIIIANRNADPTGADAPHHYTGCEGNNGYVTRYNLASQQLDPDYKIEVSVDPFDIALRKK